MSENYIPKIKKPEDCLKYFCLWKVNLGLGRGGGTCYLFVYQNQTCPIAFQNFPTLWAEYSSLFFLKIKGWKQSFMVTLLTRAEPRTLLDLLLLLLLCAQVIRGRAWLSEFLQTGVTLHSTVEGHSELTGISAETQLPSDLALWQTAARPLQGV